MAALRLRAISPVIAAVILIAVALLIAIAVANWVLGLSTGLTTTEQIVILADSYINESGTTDYVYLHIRNDGSRQVKIVKIEVVGIGSSENVYSNETLNGLIQELEGAAWRANDPININSEAWVGASISGDYKIGKSYQVRVYTDTGNVYDTFLIAKTS